MKINIIKNNNFKWTETVIDTFTISSIGIFWINGNYFNGESANRKLYDLFNFENKSYNNDLKKISQKVNTLKGHFSFIIYNNEYSFAAVDRVRSYPFFYSKINNEIYFSNDARWLKKQLPSIANNYNGLQAVKMSGYTFGNETIYNNLYSLEAGTIVYVKNNSTDVKTENYFSYIINEISEKSDEERISHLHDMTIQTFENMIQTLDGRMVMIPLSGGYDSRLILAMLKEFNYNNIIAFSYGRKSEWQIKKAKFFSDKMDVPWKFVEYNNKRMRKYFQSNDRKEFYKYASGFCSVPSITTYYSIMELKRNKFIDNSSILINGQSGDFTSGGHLGNLLDNKISINQIKINELFNSIITKHYSLWSNEKTEKNIKFIYNNLRKELKINKDYITDDEFINYYEMQEWICRQSKYVVNGQRGYEWFGLDWRLPLWSDELISFWVNTPWRIKYNQRLLLKYLQQYNFQNVFGINEDSKHNTKYLNIGKSFFPLWAKPLKVFFRLINIFSKKGVSYYYTAYLRYFMDYSWFYPQRKYFEYLKDSKYHRNVVSYWTKYFLKEQKH